MSRRTAWRLAGAVVLSLTIGFLLGPLAFVDREGRISATAAARAGEDAQIQRALRAGAGQWVALDSVVRRLHGQVLLRSDSLGEVLLPVGQSGWRIVRFNPHDPESVTGLQVPAWAESLVVTHPVR